MRAMRASQRLVYWSSWRITWSPSAPSAASHLPPLLDLGAHPVDHALVGAQLGRGGGDRADRRVGDEHLGVLPFLGDGVVDREPGEAHHTRQQQRLQQRQHDHPAGDHDDEVAVGERRARVQGARYGEYRGERDRTAEPGHAADRTLPGSEPA